ncbi:MAG: hypothetical protein N0C90_11660 [Candidatus Thiodiazotropha endolucinida]|nr:hypothetical protein [Candidatus Thiodiazotropha taylori]MCW4262016.1 hypothetical protein [Candidatus Thiodiazotropha endolucinida]
MLKTNIHDKHDKRATNSSTNIPVLISDRINKRVASSHDSHTQRQRAELIQADGDDCDDDFEKYIRRKSKRFYVGGFKPSISEMKLRHYVQAKGARVSWVSIRRYEKHNKAVVRLNVDAEDASMVLERGFWPRGISCRPWLTRNQYRNKLTSHMHSHDYIVGDSYEASQAVSNYGVGGFGDDSSAH